jgi:hypothetical protein
MTQGTSSVSFGAVTAAVSSWSSSSIIVQVPSKGTSGSVNVTVATSMGTSNSELFVVLPTRRGLHKRRHRRYVANTVGPITIGHLRLPFGLGLLDRSNLTG